MLTPEQREIVNKLSKEEATKALKEMPFARMSQREIQIFARAFCAGARFGMIAFEKLMDDLDEQMH